MSNLSPDDPLLPYEDLKISPPNIDVDHLMRSPASERPKKPHTSTKLRMGLVLDSFIFPKPRTSSWTRLLIDFYDDVDVFMTMEDAKVSPTCCRNFEDESSLNEGAFMLAKDLGLDPDPTVVDTQGPVLASPELLLSLRNLNP